MNDSTPKKSKSFSKDREFTVVLEDLRSDFKVFGESLELTNQKLDATMKMVGKNTEDIFVIKVDIREIKTILGVHGNRLARLEESSKAPSPRN